MRRVHGFGELVYDYVFTERSRTIMFQGCSGGGTVSNALAVAATEGAQSVAHLFGGSDLTGALARDELQSFGVNVDCVQLQPGKATKTIFQIVSDILLSQYARHRFTGTCPACGLKAATSKLPTFGARLATPEFGKGDVYLCDRLNKKTVATARAARDAGAVAFLDLGRPEYFRYVPAAAVISGLRSFDIVQAPSNVVSSIASRAHIGGGAELARLGPTAVLIETAGPEGLYVHPGRGTINLETAHVPPPHVDVVRDPAGAGDALFGKVAALLCIKSSLSANGIWRRAERSYRQAMLELPPVLLSLGGRGHLGPIELGRAELSGYIGKPVSELKADMASREACPICMRKIGHEKSAASKHRTQKISVGTLNLKHLPRNMLFVAEKKNAIEVCRELLQTTKSGVVVGSGGSYPVAEFIASTLRFFAKCNAHALRPFDFVRQPFECDVAIVVSYSGSSPDVQKVVNAAHDSGVRRVLVLTGNPRPALEPHLKMRRGDGILSYASSSSDLNGFKRERGFLSMAGTIAPCALWTVAAQGVDALMRLSAPSDSRAMMIEDLVAMLKDHSDRFALPVIGGGWSWPAMLDMESKFTEANLGLVHLHEAKDLSHGRFMTVLEPSRKGEPLVSFSVPSDSAEPAQRYEMALSKVLSKNRKHFPFVATQTACAGALELLISVQILVQRLGRARGVDVSKPKRIPKDGLSLYRWV